MIQRNLEKKNELPVSILQSTYKGSFETNFQTIIKDYDEFPIFKAMRYFAG